MVEKHTWYRDPDSGMYVYDVSVVINAPVDVCFADWANFESFPNLMRHVTAVRAIGDNLWHWEATVAGQHAKWEAEMTQFRENEIISWESTAGLENQGTIYFSPEGRGCRLSVHLMYDPPYGFIGDLVAERRINDEFFRDLVEDVNHFKRAVESGLADDYRRAA